MPPRTGTARKVGLKRIDAAVDALRSMGFPEALVRRTVRKLLKAYGGDDGWTFIEECSYKLLIDSILEEQEKSGRENSEPKPLESSDPTLLVENQVSEDGNVQDNSGAQVHSRQGYSKQVDSPSIESPSPKKLALHHSSNSHSSSSTAAEAVPSSFKNEQCHASLEESYPPFRSQLEFVLRGCFLLHQLNLLKLKAVNLVTGGLVKMMMMMNKE